MKETLQRHYNIRLLIKIATPWLNRIQFIERTVSYSKSVTISITVTKLLSRHQISHGYQISHQTQSAIYRIVYIANIINNIAL